MSSYTADHESANPLPHTREISRERLRRTVSRRLNRIAQDSQFTPPPPPPSLPGRADAQATTIVHPSVDRTILDEFLPPEALGTFTLSPPVSALLHNIAHLFHRWLLLRRRAFIAIHAVAPDDVHRADELEMLLREAKAVDSEVTFVRFDFTSLCLNAQFTSRAEAMQALYGNTSTMTVLKKAVMMKLELLEDLVTGTVKMLGSSQGAEQEEMEDWEDWGLVEDGEEDWQKEAWLKYAIPRGWMYP